MGPGGWEPALDVASGGAGNCLSSTSGTGHVMPGPSVSSPVEGEHSVCPRYCVHFYLHLDLAGSAVGWGAGGGLETKACGQIRIGRAEEALPEGPSLPGGPQD